MIVRSQGQVRIAMASVGESHEGYDGKKDHAEQNYKERSSYDKTCTNFGIVRDRTVGPVCTFFLRGICSATWHRFKCNALINFF